MSPSSALCLCGVGRVIPCHGAWAWRLAWRGAYLVRAVLPRSTLTVLASIWLDVLMSWRGGYTVVCTALSITICAVLLRYVATYIYNSTVLYICGSWSEVSSLVVRLAKTKITPNK